MIDIIIEENEKLPTEEQWTKKEIVGNINLFQAAGADTTRNASNTFMDYLAGEAEL